MVLTGGAAESSAYRWRPYSLNIVTLHAHINTRQQLLTMSTEEIEARRTELDELLEKYLGFLDEYEKARAELSKFMSSVRLSGTELIRN
jgi:hypothetical protein